MVQGYLLAVLYESESSMGLYLLEWIAFIRPLHFHNWYSLLVGDMHSLLAIRIPKLRVAMLATIGVVVLQFFLAIIVEVYSFP